LAHHRSLTQSP